MTKTHVLHTYSDLQNPMLIQHVLTLRNAIVLYDLSGEDSIVLKLPTEQKIQPAMSNALI